MDQQKLQLFLEKLISGAYTDEEYLAFVKWTENCSRNEYKQMLVYWEKLVGEQEVFDLVDTKLIKSIEDGLDRIDEFREKSTITVKPENYRVLWPRYIAAAVILLFLTFGSYFLFYKIIPPQQIVQKESHDIGPGGNKAILTLSNGKQIVLSEARNGILASENHTVINKNANGKLSYNHNGNVAEENTLLYNVITTPRGGQYTLILSDGTRVMLNAASSLKYPASFVGNERRVELTGEAYFEVNHNALKPFKVINNGQTVEVLGTHFNINSYADEPFIKTTLLEGSVRVFVKTKQAILKPGQQSQIDHASNYQNIKIIEDADISEAVAWKNGLFEFKNASIKQVMLDAARWYDLNVIYKNDVPDIKISGRISRNVNFSGLINLLKFGGVKLEIDGKNVTILN